MCSPWSSAGVVSSFNIFSIEKKKSGSSGIRAINTTNRATNKLECYAKRSGTRKMVNFFLFLYSAPELSITLLRCNFFISSDARGTLKKIARIVHVKGSIVRIHIQTFFLPKQRFIFFRITSLFRQRFIGFCIYPQTSNLKSRINIVIFQVLMFLLKIFENSF